MHAHGMDASTLTTSYPWPATIGVWVVAVIIFIIWWLMVRFRMEAKNEIRLEDAISAPKLLTLLEIEAENPSEE
jgi:uncharacterized membrane protein YdbT with pleckstrin-like domain